MPITETQFIVRHAYTVRPNEREIDKELAHYSPIEWRKELSQRFHSIYHSIMASEKASLAIMEYATMFRHEIDTCDSNAGILEVCYGENTSIKDIFMRVADCLIPDDKTWLKESVDDEMLQEILLPCFYPIDESGIGIVEHRCNRKEEDQLHQ